MFSFYFFWNAFLSRELFSVNKMVYMHLHMVSTFVSSVMSYMIHGGSERSMTTVEEKLYMFTSHLMTAD